MTEHADGQLDVEIDMLDCQVIRAAKNVLLDFTGAEVAIAAAAIPKFTHFDLGSDW
jgi:hypothetical protein